jgi:leucyl aminopeptidase
MDPAISLVHGAVLHHGEPALRVVVGAPGIPEHLVSDGNGATLQVAAPAWREGPERAPGPACEEIHRWSRAVGRSLRTHEWARSGDTLVDLTALREAGVSLRPAVRLAVLGLLEGLGGPTSAAAAGIHLTGLPSDPDLEDARSRALVDARVAGLARELVDARASEITPEVMASRAVQVAERSGLVARVWDTDDLAAASMGGILAVGAGSANPPYLVELDYDPDSAGDAPEPPISLIGKGVTFDSGGLSMKSPAAMVGMHSDKAGAVTVLAAMSALRDLDVPTPVRGYLPLAENLPGPGATRPGDIVTMFDGTRVEVVDTDFEGRVLMADALALAAGVPTGASRHTRGPSLRPAAVIDVATLTYQAVTALGPEIGALIARDDRLGRRILQAADRAGEPLWPLPWAPRYLDQTRSRAPGASLRNHPGSDTGRALTAALFLGSFIPPAIPWAHLDIAGPAMAGSGADARATGYGVRTLVTLMEQWHLHADADHP